MRDEIFCHKCRHIRYYNDGFNCLSKHNIKYYKSWFSKENMRLMDKPENINKNNNCEYFEEKEK